VRFADVESRLAVLPEPLPAPAGALMPVITSGDAARPPRFPPPSGAGRPAAVLALLYPDDDGIARVVLIERTEGGHHSGEVSLPGGKAEPGDADLSATALREAAEEVGLDADAVGLRLIGTLEPFWIPVSDFAVTPIVAVAAARPAFVPAPREVARIVEPPIATFLPGAPMRIVERTVRDWPLRFGAYDVDGLIVWGATARILSQLGAIIAGTDP
jgi:8-oxo-dGTP pyrophosphatase MutT (NUDIX family)